jgi:hypothetical protein
METREEGRAPVWSLYVRMGSEESEYLPRRSVNTFYFIYLFCKIAREWRGATTMTSTRDARTARN